MQQTDMPFMPMSNDPHWSMDRHALDNRNPARPASAAVVDPEYPRSRQLC